MDGVETVEQWLIGVSKENQRDSPLLRLPAELRNQIYHHVLGSLQICPLWHPVPRKGFKTYFKEQTDDDVSPIHDWRVRHNVTALTMACRQTHSETALLPFQLKPIRVVGFAWWMDFTSCFTEEQRGAIRSVEMAFCQFNTIQAFPNGEPGIWGPLAKLEGLKRITVVKACRMEEMRILGDLETWKRATKAFCGHDGVEIEFARSMGEWMHEVWIGNGDPPIG